jgi:sugar lactone lactonase YvrE
MSRLVPSPTIVALAWISVALGLGLTACSTTGDTGGVGEGEGTVAEGEGEEGEGETGEGEGEACGTLVAAPASFVELAGFTSAEDFVFDDQGNYVGIDEEGNVVRIDIAGNAQLWFPNATNLAAGMAIMANGDLVFADVELGAVMRLTEGGSLTPILGGLAYPNGLDIGTDGYIYVAENNVGRVRRVDPETGAFTIVALGLFGPNGVAMSNDPLKFYVGSFEGGGIYEVVMPSAGALGTSRIYANIGGSLPPPAPSCEGLGDGDACVTNTRSERGVCGALANVTDCLPRGPCVGAALNDACVVPDDDVTPRSCQDDGAGGLTCVVINPCLGRALGDVCFTEAGQGECAQIAGTLDCNVVSACDGLADGAVCVQAGRDGRCVEGVCDRSPCGGLGTNDECTTSQGVPGVCGDVGDGAGFTCQPDPCLGRPSGDVCNQDGRPGVCTRLGDNRNYCLDGCNFTNTGDACLSFGYIGECTVSQGYPYCDFTAGCTDDGQACAIDGRPGRCVTAGSLKRCETGDCGQDENGEACVSLSGEGRCALDVVAAAITCTPPDPCAGRLVGDACDSDGAGICTAIGDDVQCLASCAARADGVTCVSTAGVGRCVSGVCETPGPCLALGDDCGFFGTCAQQGDVLACVDPYDGTATACIGRPGGAVCNVDDVSGRCVFGVCLATEPFLAVCAGGAEGQPCTSVTPFGTLTGSCVTTSLGLSCDALGAEQNECDGQAVGAPCSEGACALGDDDEVVCTSPFAFVIDPCQGRAPGSNCSFTGSVANYNGACTDFGDGTLVCFAETHFLAPCDGADDEDSCDLDSPTGFLPGVCFGGFCQPTGGTGNGGGIDGVAVDGCGVVYASEFTTGNVYRVVDADQIELLVELPSSWVPNIKWGRGLGGFSQDVMYVADRDEGRLFGVDVGVYGATEIYDAPQP